MFLSAGPQWNPDLGSSFIYLKSFPQVRDGLNGIMEVNIRVTWIQHKFPHSFCAKQSPQETFERFFSFFKPQTPQPRCPRQNHKDPKVAHSPALLPQGPIQQSFSEDKTEIKQNKIFPGLQTEFRVGGRTLLGSTQFSLHSKSQQHYLIHVPTIFLKKNLFPSRNLFPYYLIIYQLLNCRGFQTLSYRC